MSFGCVPPPVDDLLNHREIVLLTALIFAEMFALAAELNVSMDLWVDGV